MNLIRLAIERPVTVTVGVILVALFGVLAALRLPVQLTPEVDRPLLTVQTRWEGASPAEVERDLVDEQEEQLKSVQGLQRMVSTAVEGSANVELEFRVGASIDRALLDVSDKLRQVKEVPPNADPPITSAGEVEGANAIAWFILRALPDSGVDPATIPRLRTLIEEVVKPQLERAEGVARVGVVGGVEREVHVRVDPFQLAARQLTLLDVRDAIRRRNVDVSAGSVEEGKRSYLVRTVGRFERLDELRDLVLARRDGKPVYLRDVATVDFGHKEAEAVVRALGQPSIAVNATRQSGSNVLEVMENLQAAVADANRVLLAPRGLELMQVYDQTLYVHSAIDLVLQNLWVGGTLTILMLLLFLRDPRATGIVAVAIPISVIGAFLALAALGRNLNVISLAGLAFAVGMVVDNSIVVLENIHRHRQEGKSATRAAADGAGEVWGAVLASTLTTLAVFVPVVFVEEEAGQLFRDIAIAISAAVGLSLVISVLFIPMAAARIGIAAERSAGGRRGFGRLLAGLDRLGAAFRDGVVALVRAANRTWPRRLATVALLTGAAVAGSWLLAPPMSYLPQGNQNLVIGVLIPPPGYNVDEFERMAHQIEAEIAPYWQVREGRPLPEALRRPAWYEGPGEIPGIVNFFYVARGQSIFLGARSDDDRNVRPLADLFQHAARDIPGSAVFANQRSLFERGIEGGDSVDLEVSGPDLQEVRRVAQRLSAEVLPRFGPARPDPPNYNLAAPEIQVLVDEARAGENGLAVADVGFMVQSMVDGAIVSEFRDEGVNIDVKLVPAETGSSPRDRLDQIPLFTPAGKRLPLSGLARLEETLGPSDIRHIEMARAVKLVVTPPPGVELSTVMDELQDDVLAPLRASGAIPPEVRTRLSGSADKLVATRGALQWNFVLALVITYLLLCALFEHFVHPFVILFSVPLAAVGGFLGLRVVHALTGHTMDVLTMLGFVILIGTVVNNAILIVHQALQGIRAGQGVDDALADAVRTRVRPIFMSTLTSVLGMAPLVLFPGAGSELYRGLGSVVVGGLLVSTVFTLFVVPALFGITARGRKGAEA